MSEKEIDISVFTKLLDPNNKFIETVDIMDAESLAAAMLELRAVKPENRPITMAERDKKRPRGFSV